MKVIDIESGVKEIVLGASGIAIYKEGVFDVPSRQLRYSFDLTKEESIGAWDFENDCTYLYVRNTYKNTYKLICFEQDVEITIDRGFILKNDKYVFEYDSNNKSIFVFDRYNYNPEPLVLADTLKVYSFGDVVISTSHSNPFVFRVWSLKQWSLLSEISVEDVEWIRTGKPGKEPWSFIISHVIGVYGDLVYLKLGGKYILIYRMETNKLVASLGFENEETELHTEFNELLFMTPQLDEVTGLLFSFVDYWFSECIIDDVGQKSFKTKNVKEELIRCDLGQITGNLKLPYKESKLYFATVGSSHHRNNLGVFDRSTSRVLEGACFYYPTRMDSPKIANFHHPPLRNMYLTDKILYVHYNDKDRTLARINIE